jgi:hypothetical protein
MIEEHNLLSENKLPKKKFVVQKTEQAEPPVNEEEEKIVLVIKDYLEKTLFFWDITNSADFKFTLPPTVFSEEAKINFQCFEESEVKYDETFANRVLTKDQLDEIWDKGQFKVKSQNEESKPYVWQLSPWFYKGQENIVNSFYWDMSWCVYFLYAYKYRFTCDKNYIFPNLPSSIYNFFYTFKEFYAILFGKAHYSYDYFQALKYPHNKYHEVRKEYFINLFREHPEIEVDWLMPKAQQRVYKIEGKFNEKWNEEKIKIEQDLKDQISDPKVIKEKMQDIRFEKLIKHFEDAKDLPEKIKKKVIENFKVAKILFKIFFDIGNKQNEMETKLAEEIKKEYPVRSLIRDWYDKQFIAEKKAKIDKEIEKEKIERIHKELDSYPLQKHMVLSHLNFKKYEKQNCELYVEKMNKGKGYTHYVTKIYMKPGLIKQNEYTDSNGEIKKGTYYLMEQDSLLVNDDKPFWRLNLMCTRFYASYSNILIWGYTMFLDNSFGLLGLCKSHIITNYEINPTTGIVKPSKLTFTWISSIKALCGSISQSREDYEKNSGNTFLGSKMGKVVNLVENYFFKLILGMIGLIFLYPIFVLLWSVFFFIVTILALIFVTIFIPFVIFVWNFLIYDADLQEYSKNKWFPLFVILIWRFIILTILNFILSILFCIGQFILSILFFIWAPIRYCFTELYCLLTFSLIKCNASIPKADSGVAWRISGPGMARSLFFRLAIDDALLLIRGTIEKFEMNSFYSELVKIINEPNDIFSKINKRTFANVNAQNIQNNSLATSIQTYTNILSNQYHKRLAIYPALNNEVRFSKDDLDVVLEAAYELVKDYFKDNTSDLIWKQNQLVKGSFRLLADKVFISTFTEDALIHIDISELSKPVIQQRNDEIGRLHEKLQLGNIANKSMMNVRKMNYFGSLGGSSMAADFDEGYEKPLARKQRVLSKDVANVSIPQEVTAYCMYSDYGLGISIDTSLTLIVSKEKYEQLVKEDNELFSDNKDDGGNDISANYSNNIDLNNY